MNFLPVRFIPRPFHLVALTLFVANTTGIAWTQSTGISFEETMLAADQRFAIDNFGWMVDIEGDWAVVASYRSDANGTNSGSLYIYERESGNWVFRQQRTGRASFFDRIGTSLDMDGDIIVAGAPEDDDVVRDGGSVTVFRRTGSEWVFEQILFGTNSFDFSTLGTSAATSNGVIAAGAPGDFASQGAIHVFEQNEDGDWARVQIIRSPLPEKQFFGTEVHLDGDWMVISSDQVRSVHIYERRNDMWEFVQSVDDPGTNSFSGFGRTAVIEGNTLFVSAALEDGVSPSEGIVYVYTLDPQEGRWELMSTLTNHMANAFDRFGTSIHAQGEWLIVGIDGGDGVQENTGSAAVFRRGDREYSFVQHLTASDGKAADLFGTAVAIDTSGIAIVGAPNSDVDGFDSGAGYIFEPARHSSTESAAGSLPIFGLPVIRDIYPNPASDFIELVFEVVAPGQVDIGLFDVLGRLVYRTVLSANGPGSRPIRIDVSGLSPGVYLLSGTFVQDASTLIVIK